MLKTDTIKVVRRDGCRWISSRPETEDLPTKILVRGPVMFRHDVLSLPEYDLPVLADADLRQLFRSNRQHDSYDCRTRAFV